MLLVVYGDAAGDLIAYKFYDMQSAEQMVNEIEKNEFRTFGPWIVKEG